MQRVLNIVMSEAIDELGDVDEIVMQSWLVYMTRIVEWVASGDMTVLPADLVPFACAVEGIDYDAELAKAFTASTDTADNSRAETPAAKAIEA